MTTIRKHVLDEAAKCVLKDRAATHGDAENSFAKLAAIWSTRLGVELTAAQVCIMMVDLKAVRAWDNPTHGDNWIDMAGYAACGGEVSGMRVPLDGANVPVEAPPPDFTQVISDGTIVSGKLSFPIVTLGNIVARNLINDEHTE